MNGRGRLKPLPCRTGKLETGCLWFCLTRLWHVVQPNRTTDEFYGLVSLEPRVAVVGKAGLSDLESQYAYCDPTRRWLMGLEYSERRKAKSAQIQFRATGVRNRYPVDV